MIFCGILAGGVGSRMGSQLPKQFLELGGVPIILRTLDSFCAIEEFDVIYLAVVAEWANYTRELITGYDGACGSDRRVQVIHGGKDRADSLLRVIDTTRADGGSDSDIIVTHDAVRPFVDSRMIREGIACAREHGCAGTALPATDTILHSGDGTYADSVPPRSELFCAQTPQTFRIGDYLECLAALSPQERGSVTDMCGVFTRAGRKVPMVRGSERNIKITTPFDLIVGEGILSSDTLK